MVFPTAVQEIYMIIIKPTTLSKNTDIKMIFCRLVSVKVSFMSPNIASASPTINKKYTKSGNGVVNHPNHPTKLLK